MSIFNYYNFELPRPIVASLEPVKELPPPFLVRIDTEIYSRRKFFVQVEWHDRFQDTKTVHIWNRNVFVINWDTTDYESLGCGPNNSNPGMLWYIVLSLDNPAKLAAFQVLMAKHFQLWPEKVLNFQQAVWALLNLPLWQRFQYVEKIIRDKGTNNAANRKTVTEVV